MRIEMPEKRKKHDREFREGAVRIVEETGKPIAQIARDLGVNEGTLGNWVNRARAERDGSSSLSKDDYDELKRLRAEVAELRMERDVLKQSVVLWVKEATKCSRPAVNGRRTRRAQVSSERSMSRSPPQRRTRSARPIRPYPDDTAPTCAGGCCPFVIVIARASASRRISMFTSLPGACFSALTSASRRAL